MWSSFSATSLAPSSYTTVTCLRIVEQTAAAVWKYCLRRVHARARQAHDTAKLVIYRAFVEGELDVPKHLARRVHDLYFNPQTEEFAPRTTWSLSNAFTSAFKELDPIPQFKATAKFASFLKLATAGGKQ